MIMLVGIMGVSMAACDSGAPASVSATPTSRQVVSTPVSGAETATPGVATVTLGVSGEASPTAVAPTVAESTVQTGVCSKLNLNSLTEDQVMSTIPNFSSRMVREFLEYRPYVSIQQFRREIGKYVDQSQVAEWERYVYVPVDPNNADDETLKQLPGVDDALAADLINGRPYASNEAFLAALGAKASAQQLAQATCYLGTSQ